MYKTTLKNILIIYPHWVPSNLVGVHRPRLIANYLTNFGWHPIILTVNEKYYKKPFLDHTIHKTVSDEIEVYKVKSIPVKRTFNLIGDIGLRSFFQLYKQAKKIIKEKKIDFIWVSIPSYYPALLGRMLYYKTGIPYGVDYQDPWVRSPKIYPYKSIKLLGSLWAARILEPIAVKNAKLISGVSKLYYSDVLERNFKNSKVIDIAMPLGFDPNDHNIRVDNIKYPWENEPDCKPIVYAGAFLPNSHIFLDKLFYSIRVLIDENKWDEKNKLYFLGTGSYQGKSIIDFAKEHGIDEYVHEIRERFPFLVILNFLSEAFGVIIIGSTSAHYSASKTFQVLLSNKPVFAIFHEESTACHFMKEVGAGRYLVPYVEGIDMELFQESIKNLFYNFSIHSGEWNVDLNKLEPYSSKESAKRLVEKLNIIVSETNKELEKTSLIR